MQTLGNFIRKIIDFFYENLLLRFFHTEKIVSREVFRYACCGGGNMVLDWFLYFIFYHILFSSFGNVVYIDFPHIDVMPLAITPHILAFGITFPITLLTGFLLNKYVTFTQSSLSGWNQLMRYLLIVGLNILINYVGLKFFVEICQIYPTPSKMLVTGITVLVSYFGQKYFSFKK